MSLFSSTTSFDIHHIFPTEVFNPNVRDALISLFSGQDTSIFREANSNTIPLFNNASLVSAIQAAEANGTNPFAILGFGSVQHQGSHYGYNQFIQTNIQRILFGVNSDGSPLYTAEQQRSALFDLHRFGSDLALGNVRDSDGNILGIVGGGEQFNALTVAYQSQGFDPTQSISVSLAEYIANFDSTPVDVGSRYNLEARFATVENLLAQAVGNGYLTEGQHDSYFARLYGMENYFSGNEGPTFAGTNQLTSIRVGIIYDVMKNTGIGDTSSFEAVFGKIYSDANLHSGTSVYSGIPYNEVVRLFQSISDNAADLPADLSQLGDGVLESIASNLNSILVGIGGGAIGDTAEFLNLSYDSLKTWIDTGDSTDFMANVGQFGVAVVVSAAMIAGSVAVAGLFGPAAAAMVAAAWVAYGAYDGITNILELIEKVQNDELYWEATLEDLDFAIELPIDPLVIDLDGDGLELISLDDSTAYFDLDGDGFAEQTGWVAPDDALLAIDRNGNGTIDDISELFGTERTTGYEELSELDSNADGVIDSSDTAFGDLLVWQDLNGDGESTTNELISLSDAGIVSISLDATDVDYSIEGNEVIETAGVNFADGSVTQSWEVLFNMSQLQSEVNLPATFEFDEAVFSKPYLHGFGDVADLWVSMTEDPDLLQDAVNLTDSARQGRFDTFTSGFDDFLHQWAGVEDMVWRQDVEGLETHFVFDAQEIQDIYDLVSSPDYNTDSSGSSGGSTSSDPNYYGPRPSIIAFVFGTTTPEYQVPEDELQDYLQEIDGFSPFHSDDRPGFWNFAYTTVPNLSFAAGVGSSSDGVNFTIEELEEAFEQDAPTMDVGSFVFLQMISGQNYRLADNFIAPENVVVATPSEAEIPDLEAAYAEIQGYMASRFLVQSVQSILAEEGPDADLGALEPFSELTYNPFSDEIFGYTNEFAVGVINQFRANGFGTDQDALDLLAFFAKDIPELATLVAAHFPDIDRAAIEATFGVTLVEGAQDRDDTMSVSNNEIGLGHSGNDTLSGDGGSSIFMGGTGDDVLLGGQGSDTYVYRAGDGSDVIYDEAHNVRFTDQLILTDFTVDEVQFLRTGSHDLLISLNDGETITVNQQFYDFWDRQIEIISFADGVSLDLQQIRNKSVEDQKVTGSVIGSSEIEQYFHTSGDGSYSITDYSPSNVHVNDQLVLTDQLIGDVFFQQGGNDLRILLSSGEEIEVNHHFAGNEYDMEEIIFADGEVLDVQGIADKAAVDSQFLRDQAVADQKSTGTVVGTELVENYRHTSGDGSYEILDYGRNYLEDRFVFEDLNVDDVSFSRNGTNLVMTLVTGEVVTIADHFRDQWHDIELVEFADGVVLGLQGIRDKSVADQETSGVVIGSEEIENYSYESGDGSFTVVDYGRNYLEDRFVFEDLNVDDVSFIQTGNDLVFMIDDATSVTIDNHFADQWYDIEVVEFADGTSLDLAGILAKVESDAAAQGGGGNQGPTIVGTTGNDTLDGTSANDIFLGDLGDDYFGGGSGDDTYLYRPGDGIDLIQESSGTDRIVLENLNVDDVQFSHTKWRDLEIQVGDGKVIVRDHFDSIGEAIEEIEFANGDILNIAQITAKAHEDSKALGLLHGTSGNDNYFHASGDGTYVIQELGGQDQFEFTNLNADEVHFEHSIYEDLVMTTANETIYIRDHFDSAGEAIETIMFADGTTLDLADIVSKVESDALM